MKQVVIENPVINSPFEEPRRHFRFTDEGITNEIAEQRRVSSYFIPIAKPRKKGKEQLYFDTEWTQDRIEENKFINQVPPRVKQWREAKHLGATRPTAQLLQYWTRPDRERKLFFRQIEALETLVYLGEVAKNQGDAWIENELRRANEDANPLLYRVAAKMATGSGNAPSAFTETPDQMVRRVCRELGAKKSLVVLNDEAHHCYRRRVGGEEEKLTGDDREEAEKREEDARIWISGLEAVQSKIGETTIHDLAELKKRRPQEVAFLLAKLTVEKYFRQDGTRQTGTTKKHQFDAEVQTWRFPPLLEITRRWLAECVQCKDNTFPQLLLLLQFAHDASDRIYKAIVESTPGAKALKPILRPYDTLGSTRHVDFDTTRPTYATRADRCHISHVVADTESWEQKIAQTLEDMDEVFACVKNQGFNFTIPYTRNGEEHNYQADFIARLDDGHGPDDLLNLILECTGQKKKDKEAKVATAKTLWVPAVNNHGEFGRWAFLEITDPWNAQNTIKESLSS